MRLNKCLITLCLSLSSPLVAGPFSSEPSTTVIGSGTDDLPFHVNSAWFYGQEPIFYCVVVEDNFPISKSSVFQQIDTAFSIWKKYIIDKKIDSFPSFYRLQFEIAKNFAAQENCNEQSKLTFKIGTSLDTTLSQQAQQAGLIYPLSFAYRTQLTPESKGFVWLGDKKSFDKYSIRLNDNIFLSTMVHEIGHILGNEHVSNTIMTKDFLQDLKLLNSYPAKQKEYPYKIDQSNELFINEKNSFRYVGRLGDHDQQSKSLFFKLTQQQSQNFVNAIVERNISSSGKTTYQLKIDDSKNFYSFPLILIEHSKTYFGGEKSVFKQVQNDAGIAPSKIGFTILGYIEDHKDLGLLQINFNSTSEQLKINIVQDDQLILLFKSNN